MPTTRAKPGEGQAKKLQDREDRLKAQLAKIESQRSATRDKQTGKTKAMSYVKAWLNKLNDKELRHEAKIRGFIWESFESIEQAIDTIEAAMFCGVVAQGEPSTNGEPEDKEED